MPEEFTQEIIELYLNKQLDGAALEAFEAKMNDDADFKKEIDTQGLIHRGVNKFGQDEMRAKLKKIRAEIQKTEGLGAGNENAAKVVSLGKKKRSRLLLRWASAAAIALFVGSAVYFVATNSNVSSLDLYAQYYQPFADDIQVRNQDAASLHNSASQLYKAKKYDEALPLFKDILKGEPDNAELQIVIGICQLELEHYEQANQSFSAIQNPLFKDQAYWYLAMNFLKQSDMENAKTILETIQPGEFNYAKAQEILEAF